MDKQAITVKLGEEYITRGIAAALADTPGVTVRVQPYVERSYKSEQYSRTENVYPRIRKGEPRPKAPFTSYTQVYAVHKRINTKREGYAASLGRYTGFGATRGEAFLALARRMRGRSE